MKVAIVLHLYQPPTQEESVFKQVASECYIPLLKLIKSERNHKFTLNMPLSLLEQMDKYGYNEWLNDVKDLLTAERIEVTGSGAYHPLLTKLPQPFVDRQVILNEYGLGYYFGARQGFEGEPSIMIKNLRGFFPPEMAVNMELLNTLNTLSYEWVIVDETAIPNSDRNTNGTGDIYTVSIGEQNAEFKVVSRDRNISNMLSFKRDLDMADVKKYIMSKKDIVDHIVASLDAELFGHHYKEGIFLLEGFLDLLRDLNIGVASVSEIVEDSSPKELSTLVESTWGASDNDINEGNIYPYWADPKNEIQNKLWELQDYLLLNLNNEYDKKTDDFADLPVWKSSQVTKIEDLDLRKYIEADVLLNKFLHSDKFWWASKHELPYGKVLYHKGLIEAALSYATELSKYISSEEVIHGISAQINEIQRILI